MYKEFKYQGFIFFILSASILALVIAYGSQLFLQLPPCKLCYYQRLIYVGLLVICLMGFAWELRTFFPVLIILTLLLSTSLSFFHFGVENKWFTYESECTTITIKKPKSLEEFKKSLANQDIISCDHPAAVFLGISMAGWNFVYSIALLSISIFMFKRHLTHGNKEKS